MGAGFRSASPPLPRSLPRQAALPAPFRETPVLRDLQGLAYREMARSAA